MVLVLVQYVPGHYLVVRRLLRAAVARGAQALRGPPREGRRRRFFFSLYSGVCTNIRAKNTQQSAF